MNIVALVKSPPLQFFCYGVIPKVATNTFQPTNPEPEIDICPENAKVPVC